MKQLETLSNYIPPKTIEIAALLKKSWIYQLALNAPHFFEVGDSVKLIEPYVTLPNGIIIPNDEQTYPGLGYLLSMNDTDFVDTIINFSEIYQDLISINEYDLSGLQKKLCILNLFNEPRTLFLHIMGISGHGLDLIGNAALDMFFILQSYEGILLTKLFIQKRKDDFLLEVLFQLYFISTHDNVSESILKLKKNLVEIFNECNIILPTDFNNLFSGVKIHMLFAPVHPTQTQLVTDFYHAFLIATNHSDKYEVQVDENLKMEDQLQVKVEVKKKSTL